MFLFLILVSKFSLYLFYSFTEIYLGRFIYPAWNSVCIYNLSTHVFLEFWTVLFNISSNIAVQPYLPIRCIWKLEHQSVFFFKKKKKCFSLLHSRCSSQHYLLIQGFLNPTGCNRTSLWPVRIRAALQEVSAE